MKLFKWIYRGAAESSAPHDLAMLNLAVHQVRDVPYRPVRLGDPDRPKKLDVFPPKYVYNVRVIFKSPWVRTGEYVDFRDYETKTGPTRMITGLMWYRGVLRFSRVRSGPAEYYPGWSFRGQWHWRDLWRR